MRIVKRAAFGILTAVAATVLLSVNIYAAETAALDANTSSPAAFFEWLNEVLPKPAPPQPETLKLAFTGDLMVHEWQASDAFDKSTGKFDFNYCFENVKEYLSEPDYTSGNLETTFAGKEKGYSYYPIFNAPDEFAHALKNAGFDFVTTANNHCNDKRETGIIRTIDVLDSLGIEHAGTYKSQKERDTVFIKEINGFTLALLSYTYGTNGIPLSEPYHANLIDNKLIAADISRAKRHNPDFIIILPHMGNEYEQYPREIFKKQILYMLEAGADMVIATHPHVLQPMEFIDITEENGDTRRCFVAYSLGNFISSQRTLPRDEGVILNISFEREHGKRAVLKSISYIPTWVKFVDSKVSYDIRVLSVFDALTAHEKGEETGIRPGDIARLKNVHKNATKILSGSEVSLDEIRNEYFFFGQAAETADTGGEN